MIGLLVSHVKHCHVLDFNFHDEERIVFKRGKTKKQQGTFLSTLKIVPLLLLLFIDYIFDKFFKK